MRFVSRASATFKTSARAISFIPRSSRMVEHVTQASRALFDRTGLKPEDYDFAVFQQPYGIIPHTVGERLGFTAAQIKSGVIADEIGDWGRLRFARPSRCA